ncbi:MAG TPA: flavodoxin domain-containing protein [Nocardioidaceae bacterium]|nr:flavodoxin domain-containing protein [Nocardioidaceae bacterium]
MRALVVFESMFGNTEQVAESVAEGLRDYLEADVVDVATSPSAHAGDYDVIVLGAPTHAFSLSTRRSRRDAWLRGARAGVMRYGLRDWIAELAPPHAAVTAVFDTRARRLRLLPGSARTAAQLLRRKGAASLTTPHSFYTLSERGPLADGQLERAREWGVALAILAGASPRTGSWP